MSDTPTLEQLAELATERYQHLDNGETLFIPYLLAGHHQRGNVEASPVIEIATDDMGSPYAQKHPLNGRLATLATSVGSSRNDHWLVPLDRISHSKSCASCRPLWESLDSRADELTNGDLIYGSSPIKSPLGDTFLIIDAEDFD